MDIVGIAGSLRLHSHSYHLLELAAEEAHKMGASFDLIDLRQFHLPFCSGDTHYPDYPDLEKLRERIHAAKGILLVTPEYHGGVSGVLKNVLDLLSEEDMRGKVVGLIAVLGGVHSTNAINTLRLVCRHLHCWVLPEQIIFPHSDDLFDSLGRLKDRALQERLVLMVHHLIEASCKLGY